MLGPSETIGLGRRIKRGLCARRPGQPPERAFKPGAQLRLADPAQSALALDHDRPGLGETCRHQCDARLAVAFGDGANPFGPGASLAEAAPGEDQPGPPVARRRQLFGPCPNCPVPAPGLPLLLRHLVDETVDPAGICRLDQAQQAGIGGVIDFRSPIPNRSR